MNPALSKIQNRAINAFTEAAREWLQNIVCLVVVIKENKIVDHATGTRVEWCGELFVLTAGHFAERYSPDEITIYATTNAYSVPIGVRNIHSINRGKYDAALLRVADEKLWPAQYQSAPESMICDVGPSTLAQSPYVIVGYPDGFMKREEGNDYDFGSLCYSSSIDPPSMWHSSTKRDLEFELDWPEVIYNPLAKARNYLPHGKKLAGLSGAAIWLSCINDTPIWTPQQMKLVGVFREYRSERLKAYATLSKVLRMLEIKTI